MDPLRLIIHQCEECGAGAMGEGSGEDDGTHHHFLNYLKLSYVCQH